VLQQKYEQSKLLRVSEAYDTSERFISKVALQWQDTAELTL